VGKDFPNIKATKNIDKCGSKMTDVATMAMEEQQRQ
jgi:hypothetical protein